MARLQLALTFDDGPHETLANSKTLSIIDTLKEKAEDHEKEIPVTFYVEKSRINSVTGRTILKDHMAANGHEIAIHGVMPNDEDHHKKHQDTPELQDELTDMKNLISAAEAGGQTAESVRPPGGWGGWQQGTQRTKQQVADIYEAVSLKRYTGRIQF